MENIVLQPKVEVYDNIRQPVKNMEWNWKLKIRQNTKSKIRQNTDKKSLSFLLYVVVIMCVYMSVGICVSVWMRVFKWSHTRNLKRWL